MHDLLEVQIVKQEGMRIKYNALNSLTTGTRASILRLLLAEACILIKRVLVSLEHGRHLLEPFGCVE